MTKTMRVARGVLLVALLGVGMMIGCGARPEEGQGGASPTAQLCPQEPACQALPESSPAPQALQPACGPRQSGEALQPPSNRPFWACTTPEPDCRSGSWVRVMPVETSCCSSPAACAHAPAAPSPPGAACPPTATARSSTLRL
jgi:hypothetical protein